MFDLRKRSFGPPSELTLVDASGKAVQLSRPILSDRVANMRITQIHELTFRLPKGQEAIKLVFSRGRPETIDVPFTLKNVPLR